MDRPNRKRLLKIGGVMILASLVLFSISVYLIDSNLVSSNNVIISANSTYTLPKGMVSAGDDIDYTINSNLNGFNLTSYVSYDSGATAAYVNATNSSSVTNVVVSQYSGNISLVVVNHGPGAINVDVSIGTVDYATLVTTIFGFVLLPSGIVLVGIYSYSRHVERRKEKLLRGFD